MPSIISGLKCIGRRWKNSIKASKTCKNRKVFVRSNAHTCLVFWTRICQNAVRKTRAWKTSSHQLPAAPASNGLVSASRRKRAFHWISFAIDGEKAQGKSAIARTRLRARGTQTLLRETCSKLLFFSFALVLQATHFRGELFLE